MWVFVIFSRMRVQFWKFLDLKQNIYFMRPRDTYTIESAWEFSLARGRMRNVPSGFPCNKRSAVARSQSTYHVDWSLCGSACSTMSWGADLLSCFPCSSCSSILSILCELTLRSNNHLKYGKVHNKLVLDKSRTHKFSRVHWYFPFQIPMKFLVILKVTLPINFPMKFHRKHHREIALQGLRSCQVQITKWESKHPTIWRKGWNFSYI